jgi:hypothetical protein
MTAYNRKRAAIIDMSYFFNKKYGIKVTTGMTNAPIYFGKKPSALAEFQWTAISFGNIGYKTTVIMNSKIIRDRGQLLFNLFIIFFI